MFKIGAAALAAKAALVAMLNSTAEQAREVENASRITGMSTDQLQALGYAAKASGVSAEELQHGLIHLARSAQEVANGNSEAAVGFYQMGVAALDTNGKARPIGALLADISQKLAKMPDGTQKAALAMQVFGRAGAGLIPFFDRGPAGWAALGAEAKKLGLVMGGTTLVAAGKYRESMRLMMGAIEGVKISLSERLFPAFTRSAAQFGNWIASHRQWISLGVAQAFDAVSRVLHSIVLIGERAVKLFERIWNASAGAKVGLAALAITIASMVAPWMSLITVMALVADDIEGYFDGKNSVTGRVIYGFQRMMKELDKQWTLFADDPFGMLRKWAGEFVVWFSDVLVSALASAPVRALQRSVDSGWLKRFSNLVDLGISPPPPGAPAGYTGPTSGPGIDPPPSMWTAFLDKVADIGKTVVGALESASVFLNPLTPDFFKGFSPETFRLGSFSGGFAGVRLVDAPQVTVGELHLHAGDLGGGPEGFAKQFGDIVAKQQDEFWAQKMRETGAATDR